jgi:hypothetical protein
MLNRINYLMALVKSKIIEPTYKHTNLLSPDLGTKALMGDSFKKKRSLNMGHNDK